MFQSRRLFWIIILLPLRRNIAILDLLHKRVLGQCHPSFDRLLPWCDANTRRGFGHNKQLYDHSLEATQQPALYGKSIFAMVNIYNNLPQSVVDAASVSLFQTSLTQVARTRCQTGVEFWASSFCTRTREGPDLQGPRAGV